MNPFLGKALKAACVFALKGMLHTVCDEAVNRGIKAGDKAWAKRKARKQQVKTAPRTDYALQAASVPIATKTAGIVASDRFADEPTAAQALGDLEDMDLHSRFPEGSLCDAEEAFSMVRKYEDNPNATVIFRSATSEDISITDQLEVAVYINGNLEEVTQLDATNLERED